MKLKYNAKKKTRINYRFMGYTTFENGWWHNHDLNKWELNPQHGTSNYGSHAYCRSVRAFRRKLKSAPRGVKFILCSRWVGHDVIGVGCSN